MRFADRQDAGRKLAELLETRSWTNPLVLGLARGGVPVAAVVAQQLGAPLDVLVARKIGAPGHSEFGVGALTAEGPPIFNRAALRTLGIRLPDLDLLCAQERAEARRRLSAYGGDRMPSSCADRDVLVIDDGLATGITATAAARSVRELEPRTLVFAAPVGAPEAVQTLRMIVDDVVCLHEPRDFVAVGKWYENFEQTTDDEVVAALEAARHARSG